MKLIIDMDDYDLEWIKNGYCIPPELNEKMTEMIINGTPLDDKTGYWVKYGIPRCGEQHYKCTSCGYYINFGQWGELYTKEFKYCPNCGTKMVESQERSEDAKDSD